MFIIGPAESPTTDQVCCCRSHVLSVLLQTADCKPTCYKVLTEVITSTSFADWFSTDSCANLVVNSSTEDQPPQ